MFSPFSLTKTVSEAIQKGVDAVIKREEELVFGIFRQNEHAIVVPCSGNKKYNRKINVTFSCVIRWSCASDMFLDMIAQCSRIFFMNQDCWSFELACIM